MLSVPGIASDYKRVDRKYRSYNSASKLCETQQSEETLVFNLALSDKHAECDCRIHVAAGNWPKDLKETKERHCDSHYMAT